MSDSDGKIWMAKVPRDRAELVTPEPVKITQEVRLHFCRIRGLSMEKFTTDWPSCVRDRDAARARPPPVRQQTAQPTHGQRPADVRAAARGAMVGWAFSACDALPAS